MPKRLVCHDWPEVRTADADVDDVLDALAGMTFPLAAADAVGKAGHLVEHAVDLWHDVLAVNDDDSPSRRAEGHVQNRAVFCDIDLLAAEHGIDPCTQTGFFRQFQKELEGFVGEAILRIIQVETCRLSRHALSACRIICEELAQMQAAHLLVVCLEGLPGWALGDRFIRWHVHPPLGFSNASSSTRVCGPSMARGRHFVRSRRGLTCLLQRRTLR